MAYLRYLAEILTERRPNVANFSKPGTHNHMKSMIYPNADFFSVHTQNFKSSCYGCSVFGSCGSEEEITIKTFYYYLAVTLTLLAAHIISSAIILRFIIVRLDS